MLKNSRNTTQRFVALLLMGALSLLAVRAQAPGGQRAKASVKLNGKDVVIDYGRPELRGRDVMAMAPAGTVWRMGANEATELSTGTGLKFQGLTLKPGKYTLWAKKVSDKEWVLIANKQTGQWGTEYDAKQDLGMTPLTLGQAPAPVELMAIHLSGQGNQGKFELIWGTHTLSTSFTAD